MQHPSFCITPVDLLLQLLSAATISSHLVHNMYSVIVAFRHLFASQSLSSNECSSTKSISHPFGTMPICSALRLADKYKIVIVVENYMYVNRVVVMLCNTLAKLTMSHSPPTLT